MGAMRMAVGVCGMLAACGGPVLASGGGGPSSGPLGTARFADILPPDRIWSTLLLADLDGDGDADVIAMTDERDRLAVVLAVPGGYAPPVTLDVCGSCFGSDSLASAVAVGDYTGDGSVDILLNDRTQQRTLVVPFQGGGFGAPFWEQVGSDRPWATQVLPDLDGDGRADLVYFRSQPRRLEAILSGTPGALQLREVGPGTRDENFDDITGDGIADAVFRDTDAGVLRVYPGSAAGFGEAVEVAVEPGLFWAVDLDGDGLADLIGAQPDEVWRRLNLGDGSFGPETRLAVMGVRITSVWSIGDLSGSGLPDLIVRANLNGSSWDWPWYWADPLTADGFVQAGLLSGLLGDFTARDLDGDGSPDLVSIRQDPATTFGTTRNATATVLINRGVAAKPTIGTRAIGLANNPLDVRAADLGGAAADLIVCGFDGITILRRQADGSYTEEWLRANDGARFASLVEDMDQDGHPDLIVSASSLGLEIYPGVPGGFSDQPVVYSFGDPSQIWQIAVADVTGDGLPDVVAADRTGDAIRILGGRDGAMPEFDGSIELQGAKAVGVGDVDGDGVPEIVAGGSDAAVSVFRRTTGGWDLADTKDITARAYWIDVADLDLDGFDDVALVSDNWLTRPALLYGSEDGLSESVDIHMPLRRGSAEILIADVNADGLPDIIFSPIGDIGSSPFEPAARVLLQTEPRVFVEGGAIPGRPAGGLIVADVDGDGTPDVVTVSQNANPGLLQIHSGRAAPCPADITGDGQLNFFDFAAFVALFNAGDPAADFSGDGVLNFFDFSSFVGAFNAGCP